MLNTFVCRYVVQYNDNLQKKHVWNNNKNVVQEDDQFTEIFVKKTDAEFAVYIHGKVLACRLIEHRTALFVCWKV